MCVCVDASVLERLALVNAGQISVCVCVFLRPSGAGRCAVSFLLVCVEFAGCSSYTDD